MFLFSISIRKISSKIQYKNMINIFNANSFFRGKMYYCHTLFYTVKNSHIYNDVICIWLNSFTWHKSKLITHLIKHTKERNVHFRSYRKPLFNYNIVNWCVNCTAILSVYTYTINQYLIWKCRFKQLQPYMIDWYLVSTESR